MAAIDELRRQAEELTKSTGVTVQFVDSGGVQIYIILDQVGLPPRTYCVAATDILFIADRQYPLSALDMFWTQPDVLLPDGRVPRNADQIETHADRRWRRFSWHRGTWNQNGNGLLDHFEFVQYRFAEDCPS